MNTPRAAKALYTARSMEYLPGKEAQAERQEFVRQALYKVYNECPGVTRPYPLEGTRYCFDEDARMARILKQADQILSAGGTDTSAKIESSVQQLTPEQKQVWVHDNLETLIEYGVDWRGYPKLPFRVDLFTYVPTVLYFIFSQEHWKNLFRQHEEFKKFVEQQPHAALVKRAIKKYIENG